MAKKLLIVESPAKAKTIGKYLGGDFTVKSSVGHIRDLPVEDGAIQIKPGGENRWTFTPKYEISKGKEKVVSELKSAVKASDEIYLASDPDREGEAIAWHLKEVLGPVAGGKPFRRVTYNEITKPAVLKAVAEPRDIDMPRVDAQQARRILDRIVGYKVSALLWKNIPCANSRSLSAGRVQSVALRLLVERQREIDAFVPETYYLMGVEVRAQGGQTFVAKLARLDGEKPSIGDKRTADNIILDLSGAGLSVTGVKAQPKTRHALPPFTTSTLQQAASSVLAFSPGKTMKLAQSLYERGLITYMRTDSVNVSDLARKTAADYVTAEFGADYLPPKPNIYKSKADAQGAHEAIRPTNVAMDPGKSGLDGAELKLYDLVWRRFLASQMADAKTTVRTVSIGAEKPALAHSYVFTASATDVDFEGFLKVMKLSLKAKRADGEDDEDTDEVEKLPQLAEGDRLEALRWLSDEKQTKGPPHYSEASLVKALEENGVGRPSTYAATIETLKAREYAKSEKRKLIPLERGILVSNWLTKKLDSLFNVGYTAEMESELDKVEEKGEPMDDMLSEFYAKFLKALAGCADQSADRPKFAAAFALLENVSEWEPARTVGKRTYDDKAFVDSLRSQYNEGRPMSPRQLWSLARIVRKYSSQLPEGAAALGAEFGQAGGEPGSPAGGEERNALAAFCFDVLERAGAMKSNAFLKSLKEQSDRGRTLSDRQFAILAREAGGCAGSLPDGDAVRERLRPFVPGGLDAEPEDPAVPVLIEVLRGVNEWREPSKKGKRVFDDRKFFESLSDQFARRRTLTPRQVSALKRMAQSYADRIPGFAEKTKGLDLGKKRTGAEE